LKASQVRWLATSNKHNKLIKLHTMYKQTKFSLSMCSDIKFVFNNLTIPYQCDRIWEKSCAIITGEYVNKKSF